jgi:phenylacetate-CoA ligase
MVDETDAMLDRLRPSVLPDPASRRVFAFQEQLAASQWLPRATIEERQLVRLKTLVRFAAGQAPFWRERLSAGTIERAARLEEALAALPILSRAELRDNQSALRAVALPAGHRAQGERKSSGSTGMVVTVAISDVALAVQHALTFRAHLWAGRDFSRPLAVIRRMKSGQASYPSGAKAARWGSPLVYPIPTGPSFSLTTLNTSVGEAWDWLTRVKPAYLVTYPSFLDALAKHAAKGGSDSIPLESVTTIGELMTDELRGLAAKHLAPLHDLYSSEEAGLMAIQCPSCSLYHVQSESLILEVVDDSGRPCRPGEMGRVLLTPLMNFAMPLFRYDIGDFAEVGGDCRCGRFMPVLSRILGRRRNMLTLPDGRMFWPSFGARFMQEILPVTEHQFRQTEPGIIEVWLVTENEISPAQQNELRAIVQRSLPVALDVRIRRVPAIPRPASGKHEEFVSAVGEPQQ